MSEPTDEGTTAATDAHNEVFAQLFIAAEQAMRAGIAFLRARPDDSFREIVEATQRGFRPRLVIEATPALVARMEYVGPHEDGGVAAMTAFEYRGSVPANRGIPVEGAAIH